MGSELRVERSSTARNQRRFECRGRQSYRRGPPPRADGGRRGEPVRPDPGTAPQSNGQRFHLRPCGVEVWRAGSRGRGEHFGLLHNGRNVAQHRAHAARARGSRGAPGFSVAPPARLSTEPGSDQRFGGEGSLRGPYLPRDALSDGERAKGCGTAGRQLMKNIGFAALVVSALLQPPSWSGTWTSNGTHVSVVRNVHITPHGWAQTANILTQSTSFGMRMGRNNTS